MCQTIVLFATSDRQASVRQGPMRRTDAADARQPICRTAPYSRTRLSRSVVPGAETALHEGGSRRGAAHRCLRRREVRNKPKSA
jgi:hypothetical protein